jgi:alkyl hydroperoxide reductase subunit AhpC
VLAISNDANPSKKAWADSLGGISYEMLSDYHPHGAVARSYGLLRDDGLADRALVVVDKDGIVRWTKRHEIPEQPDIEELLGVLETL